MTLLEKINNDKELLEKISTIFYFMTKQVANFGFTEFLEEHDMTIEEWDIVSKWLKDNGIETYC